MTSHSLPILFYETYFPMKPIKIPSPSPTAGFKLTEKAGGSQVEIEHVQELLFQRLLPLTIGLIIISLMGFTLLGNQGGGEGVLADLLEQVKDHPLWSKLAKFLIIGGIAFLSFRIAWIALGTLHMKVDSDSFRVKKGILGMGFSRSVSRSQIAGFKQLSWTEKQKNESTEVLETVRYWKLELQGDKTLTLLSDETSPRDTDWLGQYLSDWFEVPLVKEEL